MVLALAREDCLWWFFFFFWVASWVEVVRRVVWRVLRVVRWVDWNLVLMSSMWEVTISVMRLMANGVESGECFRTSISGSDRIWVTDARSADSVRSKCMD